MLTADLGIAAAYLQHRPPPGRVLLCAVTGAHLYGFPSPDSDLDLKGIHLAPTTSLLGLHPNTPAHDHTEIFRNVECDLTTNEAADALRLLGSGNGNMLERILSPLQIVPSEEIAELQALARGAVSARFARHYAGFLRGKRRELNEQPTTKGLLYAYRVALTGIHLLRSGELDPNLPSLVDGRAEEQAVSELIARKRSADEHATIDDQLLAEHLPAIDQLGEELADAETNTSLPPDPPNVREIEDWLIRSRIAEIRAHIRDHGRPANIDAAADRIRTTYRNALDDLAE